MLKFLHERIWDHLPTSVTPRTRLLAAVLWSGALVVYGLLLMHARARNGAGAGTAPYVLITLGLVIGAILLFPKVGATFYLWVLRILAIPGFFITMLLLILAFYLIVTPMGVILRLAGKDLLRTGPRSKPEWIPHPGPPERKRFYRQF